MSDVTQLQRGSFTTICRELLFFGRAQGVGGPEQMMRGFRLPLVTKNFLSAMHPLETPVSQPQFSNQFINKIETKGVSKSSYRVTAPHTFFASAEPSIGSIH